MNPHRFIVGQLGARMHYAVPRILHSAGMLERFYTDICAVRGWPRLLKAVPAPLRPAPVRRLLGRLPHGVPPALITAFTALGTEYARRRARAQTPSEMTAAHLWAGRAFCEEIVRRGLTGATGVYTFNSAGLEVLQAARARGLRCVMEQTIAPRAVERRLLTEEQARFPDWEPMPSADAHAAEFCAREEAEWAQADVILTGSEFVRDGIAACGGPVERCAVVPYGVDPSFTIPERPAHAGPLRVLVVGAVGLRKGSPYVLEAARLLNGTAQIRMVGAGGDRMHTAVELPGPVPRAEIGEQYAWADVFLLPSLCEGSATVVYEALAAGLPVICTPNTGSVVRDGIDGFIVPIRNAPAIAAKLELLAAKPTLRAELGRNARVRAAEFTLAQYGQRLVAALC